MQVEDVTGLVIERVYVHDSSTGVVDYNGNSQDVVIRNSVFESIPRIGQRSSPCAAICMGGSNGLNVTHVTMRDAAFVANVNHDGDPATNITLKDSILSGPPGAEGSPTYAAQDHNLCLSGTCTGTGSLNGAPAPTWVGGQSPTRFAGFALAPGSRGEDAASDGTDIGVNP
jgi:hypothetical protein